MYEINKNSIFDKSIEKSTDISKYDPLGKEYKLFEDSDLPKFEFYNDLIDTKKPNGIEITTEKDKGFVVRGKFAEKLVNIFGGGDLPQEKKNNGTMELDKKSGGFKFKVKGINSVQVVYSINF